MIALYLKVILIFIVIKRDGKLMQIEKSEQQLPLKIEK
jgi:hypothetical protein